MRKIVKIGKILQGEGGNTRPGTDHELSVLFFFSLSLSPRHV